MAPRWQRRKEERPGDIVAAALKIFAEKGFAGAKMEAIAAEAGLSKGALYLYFPTKEEVFRAVVERAVAPNIDAIGKVALTTDLPFADRVRMLLPRLGEVLTCAPIGAVAKMVLGESRNFPELAKVWHDNVVARGISLLCQLVEQAQEAGEVRPGDPRIHAFSIMGPMMIGALWRETFTPIGGAEIDLVAVATQHAETVLEGLLGREEAA
ncbi:MAG TPA: TetR/AcrR family transcriptional regulator [Allosphingosinicella sp.]|nr:TetR/AcrR family transcriptional regulator [Allosphingosinicella sp.]